MTYIQLGYAVSAGAVVAGFASGYVFVTVLGIGLLFATIWEAGKP